MFASNASGSRLSLRHPLAGLQAGILGALVMLAWLMIASVLENRSIWLVPNLFAATFFGSDVYVNRYLQDSWSGIALFLAIYGLLGAVWGCLWRDESKPWLGLFGGIFGLAVYYVFFDFIWKRFDPLMTLYAPSQQLRFGHILWGIILHRSPKYARAIAARMAEPAADPGSPQITFTASQETGEVVK